MSDYSVNPSSDAQWAACPACGLWQHQVQSCGECGWDLPAVQESPIGQSAELRVLVDATLKRVGTALEWRQGWTADIRCARLPSLAGDPALIEEICTILSKHSGNRFIFPDQGHWKSRKYLQRIISERIATDIRKHQFPTPENETKPLPLLIAIRCALLDPGFFYTAELCRTGDWFALVPFDKSAEAAAKDIAPNDITFRNHQPIGLLPSKDRLAFTITSTKSVIIDRVDIACREGQPPLQEFEQGWILHRDREHPIDGLSLKAESIRRLNTSADDGAIVRVWLKGRDEPFTTRVSLDLPSQTPTAELILDIGSTTVKLALAISSNGSTQPKWQPHNYETRYFLEMVELDDYNKADFVGDEQSNRTNWCNWWTRALPKLRYWIARQHGAYLTKLRLSIPVTSNDNLQKMDDALKGNRGLADAKRDHLAYPKSISLAAEHQLIANHYLSALNDLELHAIDIEERFQKDMQAKRAHIEREGAIREYEEENFMRKLWHWVTLQKPKPPSGSRPEPKERSDKLKKLGTRPSQLERVMVLDAGGLSLDVAILETNNNSTEVLHPHGRSLSSCGGEELSARIGERKTGLEGTQYKAKLSLLAVELGQSKGDPRLEEYEAETRRLYDVSDLQGVFEWLGEHWKNDCQCVALMTGGASCNPYFQSLILRMAANVGLDMWPLDAANIVDIIEELEQDRDQRNNELTEAERFKAVYSWSRERENNRWSAWDMFAVVGGHVSAEPEAGSNS